MNDHNQNQFFHTLTGSDGKGAESILSGHRPVLFDEAEDEQLLPPEDCDFLLVRSNLIVASTAREGRYAAGQTLFSRNPERFGGLCDRLAGQAEGDAHWLAFPHVRSMAMASRVLLAQTDLLVVVLLHGNTTRVRRVLHHCFVGRVKTVDVATGVDADVAVGGLRRGDEPFYRGLSAQLRLYRTLFLGVGSSVEIKDRAQLMQLLSRRMKVASRLVPALSFIPVELDPHTQRYVVEELPVPCAGTVNISHLTASVLCLLLGVSASSGVCELQMQQDDKHLYPRLLLLPGGQDRRAVLTGELSTHPAMLEMARLALCHGTVFSQSFERGGDGTAQWSFSFSPMCPSYGELYTLRASKPQLSE
jgi:hypothetical protein